MVLVGNRVGWSRLVVALLIAFAPGELRAQPSESDRALATQLFTEGRKLMAGGKHAEACPKLEESQRLDPGGGTLLNVAACHEKVGKTATAWTEYKEAVAVAERDGRADREELAQKRLAALEPQLTHIQIDVPAEAVEPDMVITRNGVVIARAAWGTTMPLDPGEYTIKASAPGKEDWLTTVTLATAGTKVVLSVPELIPFPSRPPEPVVSPPRPRLPAQVPDGPRRHTNAPFLIAGGLTAGVGAVGLTIGTVFGVLASNHQSKLDGICTAGRDACPHSAAEDISEMQTFAKASTASLVIGGVALATGGSLVIVGIARGGEHGVAVQPWLGPGSVGLMGRF